MSLDEAQEATVKMDQSAMINLIPYKFFVGMYT